MSNKKVIRWGILSTAKIGRELVIPAIAKCSDCKIAGIGSLSPERAQTVADKFDIPSVYDSYEDLCKASDIDAIYNPLPNHMHVEYSKMAAKYGKHVLCEKPVSLNAAEAESLRSWPDNLIFMEAFMIRFHYQWIKAREIVHSGKIGEVRAVQVFFSYNNTDPDNIRNKADIGGGAMPDIGGYASIACRIFFGKMPKRIMSLVDFDPVFKTDRLSSAMMDFGDGRQGTFTVSTQLAPYQRVVVAGTKGRLEIQIPFNAPIDRETKIFVDDCTDLTGKNIQTITLPACDQYQLEVHAFNEAARGNNKLNYGIEDAIENMRMIDAVFKSAKTAVWVEP